MQVPVVITTAAPPTEKRERMRSSDMKSTFMGGASDSDKASPRGLGSDRGGSDAGSTGRRRGQGSTKNFELQRTSIHDAEKGSDSTKPDDDLPIDETTGMQIVQHDLELNHQQRLQLRIAKERGINIDNLMSEDY
jgi:hypothetical protein